MGDQPVYVRTQDAHVTHHQPQYVYEGTCPVHSAGHTQVICQLTSNTNESMLWCADDCKDSGEWTQLRKSFQGQGVRMAQVWHDTGQVNLATGKVESDPKKFREHLHVTSHEAEERLGMPVDYQPTDPTDKAALGVTDEGLDATHDHQVRTGQKDSRGRFVF